MTNYTFDLIQNSNNERSYKMNLLEYLKGFLTDNEAARILDYFISHRYHPYTLDQVAKDLELSNKILLEAISQYIVEKS